MMASLVKRIVVLWDDYWFFRINVVVLVVGVLFLLFS